jgi:hypothetical protein
LQLENKELREKVAELHIQCQQIKDENIQLTAKITELTSNLNETNTCLAVKQEDLASCKNCLVVCLNSDLKCNTYTLRRMKYQKLNLVLQKNYTKIFSGYIKWICMNWLKYLQIEDLPETVESFIAVTNNTVIKSEVSILSVTQFNIILKILPFATSLLHPPRDWGYIIFS